MKHWYRDTVFSRIAQPYEEYSSHFISFPYNETEAAKQILGKITLKVSTKCSK